MARGLSVHIGVNECDPSRYAGWSGRLEGCESDCDAMSTIAKAQGFDVTILKTAEATRGAVIAAIERAATGLEANDVFLLTYAGHGNRHRDLSGDEPDGYDETFCLHDGELFDDELRGLWATFKPHAGVVVIADSCHSGSVTRGISDGSDTDGVARAMPAAACADVRVANRATYNKIKASARAASEVPVTAGVLLLSGCNDDELSKERDGHGLFTAALTKVWNDGAFNGTYRDFREIIMNQLPREQNPQIKFYGDTSVDLTMTRPFSIGGAR